jgi:hypothetical protein
MDMPPVVDLPRTFTEGSLQQALVLALTEGKRQP